MSIKRPEEYFCPFCGAPFNREQILKIKRGESVICEYCGFEYNPIITDIVNRESWEDLEDYDHEMNDALRDIMPQSGKEPDNLYYPGNLLPKAEQPTPLRVRPVPPNDLGPMGRPIRRPMRKPIGRPDYDRPNNRIPPPRLKFDPRKPITLNIKNGGPLRIIPHQILRQMEKETITIKDNNELKKIEEKILNTIDYQPLLVGELIKKLGINSFGEFKAVRGKLAQMFKEGKIILEISKGKIYVRRK
ncbi:MAG: hypothetical protein ACTSU2_08795 [Promethearchaeota archaeon]